MLFAPKSGNKTRDLLKEKADEGKEYLKHRSPELRDSATDIIEERKGSHRPLDGRAGGGRRRQQGAYGEAGESPAPSEGSTVA